MTCLVPFTSPQLAGLGTAAFLDRLLSLQSDPPPHGLARAEGVEEGDWAAIEAAVRARFPREAVVAPGDVEIDGGTAWWPRLGQARGRVAFVGQGAAASQIDALGPDRILHRCAASCDVVNGLRRCAVTRCPYHGRCPCAWHHQDALPCPFRYWDLWDLVEGDGKLREVSRDTLFLQAEARDPLLPQAVAQARAAWLAGVALVTMRGRPSPLTKSRRLQGRIVTGIGALMDAPGDLPGDSTEPAEVRVAQAEELARRYVAVGAHIVKTDYVVPQEVRVAVGSLIRPERFSAVDLGGGAVVQCNRAALGEDVFQQGRCAAP